jgi:hypothetical protein
VKQSGPYIGRECLNLKSLKTEKTRKLNLSNTERRDETGFHDMVANPNDTLCIVRIYKILRSHYPEDYKGSILRRPLPQKEVDILQKFLGKGKFVPMADLSKKGKFGKNYTTTVCRRVAARCGFENPEKHTAAGRRRTGITELVSSDTEVPSSELLISSRHKSVITSAKYQASNENAHAKRYQATMYDEPKKGTVLYVLLCYVLFILTNVCTGTYRYVLQMMMRRSQLLRRNQLLLLYILCTHRPLRLYILCTHKPLLYILRCRKVCTPKPLPYILRCRKVCTHQPCIHTLCTQ